MNALRDQNFLNHNAALKINPFWPKNIVFASDLSFRYLGNVTPGIRNSLLLFNVSLGYQFWDDDATLQFKLYDMLDQKIQEYRIFGNDYIADNNTLILTQ